MKKILKLCLPAVMMLVGCNERIEISSQSEIAYDYDLVSDKHIEWKSIFEQEDNNYYVYIYSMTCGHCRIIKDDVISYALSHDNFYFVIYSASIPLINNRDLAIGKDSIYGLGIMGTPSLFEINSHIITNYYLGTSEIIETLSNHQ